MGMPHICNNINIWILEKKNDKRKKEKTAFKPNSLILTQRSGSVICSISVRSVSGLFVIKLIKIMKIQSIND